MTFCKYIFIRISSHRKKYTEKNKHATNTNAYIRVLIDTYAHSLSTNIVYTVR